MEVLAAAANWFVPVVVVEIVKRMIKKFSIVGAMWQEKRIFSRFGSLKSEEEGVQKGWKDFGEKILRRKIRENWFFRRRWVANLEASRAISEEHTARAWPMDVKVRPENFYIKMLTGFCTWNWMEEEKKSSTHIRVSAEDKYVFFRLTGKPASNTVHTACICQQFNAESMHLRNVGAKKRRKTFGFVVFSKTSLTHDVYGCERILYAASYVFVEIASVKHVLFFSRRQARIVSSHF